MGTYLSKGAAVRATGAVEMKEKAYNLDMTNESMPVISNRTMSDAKNYDHKFNCTPMNKKVATKVEKTNGFVNKSYTLYKLEYHSTKGSTLPDDIENSFCESNDYLNKTVDVTKLMSQLFTGVVVLEKLEDSLIKSLVRQFPVARAVSLHTDADLDDEKAAERETNNGYAHRYCDKCKKIVLSRIKDPKTKNCSNCKTPMTYLCTKCNVKHYKRYPFLMFHWDRCEGIDKSSDCVGDVVGRRNESIIEDKTTDDYADSTLTTDESQLSVKQVDDGETNNDYVHRYCDKCKKIVLSRIKDPKTKNCSDCKTPMTYLCTKCNVKHYKRYPFFMFHWDRCEGIDKSSDCVDGDVVDRPDDQSIEDETTSDVCADSTLIPDKNQFVVKEIGDGNALQKYTRYCPDCNVTVANRQLSRCLTCKSILHFACTKCNAKYSHSTALHYHSDSQCYPTHQYQCMHCQYNTTCWGLMRSHYINLHTKRPTLKCELCPYETKYRKTLNRHMRSLHLDVEDEFQCDKCVYSTNFLRNFQRHKQYCP